MKAQILKTICATVLLCNTWSFSAVAGDRHHRDRNVFHDYARVVHVKPKYRVVTEHVPQRTCDMPRRHQHLHSHNSHGNQRHDAGAIFISGVIGGAIGHELSRSVNGKSNPGAVIAGASIGAGLAAGHQPHNSRHTVTHRQQSAHQKHRKPHCTTTTHVQKVRHPDGYLVTYRYQGHTYQTHTDRHPGDRIAIRVAISTRH